MNFVKIPNASHYARRFSLVIFSVLLTACATSLPFLTEVAAPRVTWQERNQRLANLRQWSVSGRLAIRANQDAWNVGMHWRQKDDDYRIRFHGPLALGSAEIVGGPDGVLLRTTRREEFFADDPESLLSDTLGWRIPVSGLRNWILGRPEKDISTDELEIDTRGRLKRLHQSGWEIRYLDYRLVGDIELPTRLDLKNARFDARIRIGKWTLPPPLPSPFPEDQGYRKTSLAEDYQ
uniref:Outer-membrane lipoprotein LolB n=1 Tax=Candidatus Kentrum sp. SD TaxID=2126332 RepID=A0A450YL51_9GAMM|nr:MAG: outer membrane lipoprotein LolB [Candidatus Kentron sp. SD]VFK48089.1 MAG: outer membrane lipoprotein LolB [Candidatus Kentron sp. SD]